MATTTTNYGLTKPARGDSNWDVVLNNNFDSIDTQIKVRENDIASINSQIGDIRAYGLRYKVSTGQLTRLGAAAGKTAITGGVNDFDNIMPWAGMRRCNLADNLDVLAYYGDANYKEDGSNGQVMVETPAFYYKRGWIDSDTLETWVSALPLAGFKRHPLFYDVDGNECDKAYVGANEGSIFDASAGAYLLADEQVADFTAGTGDKLCSIAGAKPCSGLTQNLTIGNTRILANNRGIGWEQLFNNAVSAIQMLLIVEYGSLDSQGIVGLGVTNKTDDGASNLAVNTGGTSILGNKSGIAPGTNGLVSVSYRGIENFWGNIWTWVDGINIQNQKAFISKVNGNFASDKFDGNYKDSGILIPNANNYVSKVGVNYNVDWAFLPTDVSATSSSGYHDYLYQNPSGNFVARLGGLWSYGLQAGAFNWALYYGSGYRGRDVGARLCAVKKTVK